MAKSNKKIKVSLIILTYNSLKMTKEMLVNVSSLATDNLDVSCILVDNGSTDGTEQELKSYKIHNMDYVYINTGQNLGYAGGNNYGFKMALDNGCEYVIVLNNDIVMPENLVVKLVDFMKNNPKYGAASPKMYFAKGYEFHKERYSKTDLGKVIWYAGGLVDWDNIYTSHRGVDEVDNGQYSDSVETESINGACAIFSREALVKAGLLDESLFLYWEDMDFSMRIKRYGFAVGYTPDTCIWHKVSTSAGGSGGITNDYFITRNRLYFALRYAKLRTKFAVLRDTFKKSLFGRTWEKIGAQDALLAVKGKGRWANK